MVNGSISKQKMLAGRFPTQQGVISASGDSCPHQIQYLLIWNVDYETKDEKKSFTWYINVLVDENSKTDAQPELNF